jgi:PAS domain-containing protein
MEDIHPEDIRIPAIWPKLSFICAGIILCLGIFFSIRLTLRTDDHNRTALLSLVRTAAYLSPSADIANLLGSESDLGTPAYQSVKNRLMDLRQLNPDARFIYYMRDAGHDNKLLFLADSEDPSSADYSPPGQVYQDTSSLEYQNYIHEVAFTEGPYTDRWGLWVSAYAPVRDAQGMQVGIIGMDVNGKLWTTQLVTVFVSVLLVSALAAGLLVMLGLYLSRSLRILSFFKRMNEYLAREKKHVDEIVGKAHIGEWTYTPKTGKLLLNEAMYDLLHVSRSEPLTLDTFKQHMTVESIRAFENALDDMIVKGVLDAKIDVEMNDGRKLHMRISSSGPQDSIAPVRISGIAQEHIA